MRVALLRLLVLGSFVLVATEARAQTREFTAHLSGGNEAPTVVSTGAYGVATVTLNMSTQEVTYRIQVFNMPSGTTQAHFHVGGPGAAGPIVVNIPVSPQVSNDFTLSSTAGPSLLQPRPDSGIRSWEDFIQSLVGGQLYLNVHSNVNPGGEIRGQVIPAQ